MKKRRQKIFLLFHCCFLVSGGHYYHTPSAKSDRHTSASPNTNDGNDGNDGNDVNDGGLMTDSTELAENLHDINVQQQQRMEFLLQMRQVFCFVWSCLVFTVFLGCHWFSPISLLFCGRCNTK